jgi:hypothetical protein
MPPANPMLSGWVQCPVESHARSFCWENIHTLLTCLA